MDEDLNIERIRQQFSMLKSGDSKAFAIIFNEYFGHVHSVALRYCKIESYAEDIAQQVFLALWQSREDLEDVKNPEAWLWVMTKNQTLNFLRKVKNEQRNISHLKFITTIKEEHTPFHAIANKQQNVLIEEAISELPQRQQEVYRLNKLEGLSYREIAERLNISVDTVKEHLINSGKFLRKKLYGISKHSLLLIFF